jgi:hypothetical protein
MCYRCSICRAVVGPGNKLIRHTIYRPLPRGVRGKEIERQLPICRECEDDLKAGISLRIMLEEHHRKPVCEPVSMLGVSTTKLSEAIGSPSQEIGHHRRAAVQVPPRPVAKGPVKLFGRSVLADRAKKE